VSGSAAEQAGLHGPRRAVVIGNFELGIGGDLITAVEGQQIDRADTLTRYLNRKRPGDKIRLTIFRGGRSVDVTVTLGEGGNRL
jgi:S1-C subfamily serine protease